MELYTKYNPPPKVPRVQDWGPGKTRQSEKAACDINKIVGRFRKTGILPAGVRQGIYADVSTVTDYREALDRVMVADKAFMMLPAAMRAKFANDPAEFLDFCSNPANRDELVELGLVPKEESVPAPKPVEKPEQPADSPPSDS